MMNLRSFAEKTTDADVLREMIAFAAEWMKDIEVGALTGVGHGRRARRDGCSVAATEISNWKTRASTVELGIPRLRRGCCFHGFL